MGSRPVVVENVYAIAPMRVGVRLSDGTHRVTIRGILDSAGIKPGSEWRPEYDAAPIVLKTGDPGFV